MLQAVQVALSKHARSEAEKVRYTGVRTPLRHEFFHSRMKFEIQLTRLTMKAEGVGGRDAGGQRPPEQRRRGVSGRRNGRDQDGRKDVELVSELDSELVSEATPDDGEGRGLD